MLIYWYYNTLVSFFIASLNIEELLIIGISKFCLVDALSLKWLAKEKLAEKSICDPDAFAFVM